jgi:hypothetical protein
VKCDWWLTKNKTKFYFLVSVEKTFRETERQNRQSIFFFSEGKTVVVVVVVAVKKEIETGSFFSSGPARESVSRSFYFLHFLFYLFVRDLCVHFGWDVLC